MASRVECRFRYFASSSAALSWWDDRLLRQTPTAAAAAATARFTGTVVRDEDGDRVIEVGAKP